jgi:hypothetical protein
MTAHITKPFINVQDSNGVPIVGAKLYVYDVGTTDLADIWSDDALSVSVPNPLSGANASDASGNFPRVYLASGTYKLRAVTSADALIWEYDDIDTSLTSGSGALAISAGGTSATTAAGARTALGVASQTDVDDLAADIATLTSSLQALVSSPQGRLTLTSATPVLASGVSAGTSVYYTPYCGNQIPIWDNTQFNLATFAELTLTLNANHLANAIYDLFVWKESGVVTIGTGPAWNTATAGAGARGSGAGTTEIERTAGLWTNANDMTTRNGATTYTVGENLGTYVGTLSMDGTNGQASCLLNWGVSRRWAVWNAYNRVPVVMRAGEAAASWYYNTANTYRAANGNAVNNCELVVGLPEERLLAMITQTVEPSDAGAGSACLTGIGYNSTTVVSGAPGRTHCDAVNQIFAHTGHATVSPMAIGLHRVSCIETVSAAGGASNQLFYGGSEALHCMTVEYRG